MLLLLFDERRMRIAVGQMNKLLLESDLSLEILLLASELAAPRSL